MHLHSTFLLASLSLFTSACTPHPLGTIDVWEERYVYRGEFRQSELGDGIQEVEPSELTLTLYPCEPDQCAKGRFTGALKVPGYTVEGPISDEMRGVTIDEREAWAQFEADPIQILIYGIFSQNREELYITVDLDLKVTTKWLGDLDLKRINEVPEKEEDEKEAHDTGDTGQ